jgi:hypothetical protein
VDESPRTITRGWLITLIGIALLAGGLVGLCFPVFLGSYDSSGVEVKCGNGYRAELVQATTDDERTASGAAQPATSYVHQCMSALAHRRAWLIPVAAVGALILIPELLAWSRAKPQSSDAETDAWSEDSVEALHEAEVLDRQYHRRWKRPTDTTW